MSAYQLGPLVLSAPRLFAAIALAVLLVTAELVARRRNDQPAHPGDVAERTGTPPASVRQAVSSDATWAWNAALAVLIGARVGYVLENLESFLSQPLAIFQFWQGGFSPWWGVGAGVVVLASAARAKSVTLRAALLPAILSLGTWLLVPAILSPAQVGDRQLPTTALMRLEGGALDIATLRGRPVVVNLWATWCPPCRRELPMLAAATQTHPEVQFILAAQGESRATVVAYLSEHQDVELSDVVLDEEGRLASEFGSVGLPTTLFFDTAGRHVQTHAGEMSSVMLGNYLSDLIPGGR